MSYTQIGIVNVALRRIASPPISAMGSGEAGRIAQDLWEYVRDEVLADYEWPFAKDRAELAQRTTTPVFGWDYEYAKPVDCLSVLWVGTDGATDPVPFDSEGSSILTDYDNTTNPLYVRFLKRITDPSLYTPHFCKALAIRLASEFAIPIKESSTLRDSLLAEYIKILKDAKGKAALEGYVEDERGSTAWLDAGRR